MKSCNNLSYYYKTKRDKEKEKELQQLKLLLQERKKDVDTQRNSCKNLNCYDKKNRMRILKA